MPSQDNHLEYYRRELRYLRTESANFAARHPKVARGLVPGDAHSPDPHIQHLIESVAFTTYVGNIPASVAPRFLT